MLVLDTDLLTIVQFRSGTVYERLNARLESAAATEVIGVSIISIEEQMRGWLSLIARSKTMDEQIDAYKRLHTLFDDFQVRPILNFDARAGEEYQCLVKQRIRIGTMDLKIAAIALSQGAKLLSRNLSDFRKVPGLSVEDWTAA
ncbi:MAG: type II toxin-antitoxin system VapC family toxin [Gemmataceae bacterium]